ncbi:unnamed protein product [Rotaria socialis]|nr:unnamed protein product [Rotaria socialis]CAF3419155.1 unnamed protein product [Rotaria socialis]CAF3736149.1 unnamed protein product [Rotaria socialis]CAF4458230.1 unnamed protein product [Rotaria socialis]CAF4676369.1 unnamed protein product [Rotaria socialis]
MTIDSSKISSSITPFAMIDKHSALPQEQEILFTVHTVFRIVEITQTPKNSRLWEVQLTITGDEDPQLAGLTNLIKEEIDGRGWYRMGQLMLQVGHFNQAEELYNELLVNASTDSDRANIYNLLGWVKRDQGQYKEAVSFLEKALKIDEETLSENDLSLATSYNNIAMGYDDMGDYSKALEYYEKANKILEISLPPTHPHLAISYDNIGGVYNNMGEYPKALEYYQKANKIFQISLPPTHPDLAISYWSIGDIYNKTGEYSKALSLLEKALGIFRKSLPSTHPDIKSVMNSIEEVKEKL